MVAEEQLAVIYEYFEDLNEKQRSQVEQLNPLYHKWNERINVISRKDIDNLYLHHVLHSLAVAKIFPFEDGAEILDLGTGGGLPGIPLAILYPEVRFHLIDGTAKKLKVVDAIAENIGLDNIRTSHQRIEYMEHGKYDFVTARAVSDLKQLIEWTRPHIKSQMNHVFPNGLLAYTGGNIEKKIKSLPNQEYSEVFPISDIFIEDYFHKKYIVYIQA